MWPGLLVGSPSPEERSRPPRPTAPLHLDVCPPSSSSCKPYWTQRLLDWLHDGAWHHAADSATPHDQRPLSASVTPLSAVRLEFIACLDDIDTRQAAILATRLRHANSLRELWHLRAELFDAVSHSTGQAQATTRLARLNRHFPTRAPRSTFGTLDSTPIDRISGS